jgi:hypothetical protein
MSHNNLVRSLAIPSIFVVGFLLTLINPWFAVITPPLAPLVSILIRRYFARKHPEVIHA